MVTQVDVPTSGPVAAARTTVAPRPTSGVAATAHAHGPGRGATVTESPAAGIPGIWAAGVVGGAPPGSGCVCPAHDPPSHQRSAGAPCGSLYHPGGGPAGAPGVLAANSVTTTPPRRGSAVAPSRNKRRGTPSTGARGGTNRNQVVSVTTPLQRLYVTGRTDRCEATEMAGSVHPRTRLHLSPLHDMGSPKALSSNILSNKLLESGWTGSVKAQVRRPVISRAMMVFMISLVPP